MSPDKEALWHADTTGIVRLSHAEAMARIAERLRAEPAQPGDVAYLEAPKAAFATRLALHAFVGDGLTSTTIGREGRASEDITQFRPHKMWVGAAWLEAACAGRGPRWPAGLDGQRARRRLQEVLGDRLRWVETERLPERSCGAAVAAFGARLHPGDLAASREAGH